MNNRIFIWIVILMAISFPGIVVVQFIWYHNSVMMNNELFGKIVQEVLSKTVLEFEYNQDIRTIDENLYDDAWDGDSYPPSQSQTTVSSKKNNSPHGKKENIKTATDTIKNHQVSTNQTQLPGNRIGI